MLAKEVDEPFDDADWIFEIKWDGYRAIAELENEAVKLYSRNGNSFLPLFTPVADALANLNVNAVLDGEVVILQPDGKSDFQSLQHYDERQGGQLAYMIFDLLQLNGEDTTGLSLLQRKELLKMLLPKDGPVKYSDHVVKNGKAFYNTALQADLEGIMAKKADSTYSPGVRTTEWLKIKQHKTDEAIVVGFTQPTGGRSYIGALVLAVKKAGKLIYAGHTGSGFTDERLKELYGLLSAITTTQSPFTEKVKTNMPVTWVEPKYIAEIKFTEKTRDGKMRHPIFLRLRNDKNIKDITMPSTTKTATKKTATKASAKDSGMEKFGGKAVKITHRSKVYFPGEGITKGDVIDYYQSVATYILPYLKARPESLKRNPNGISGQGFYHKDAAEDAPDFVENFPVFSESSNKMVDYIVCNNKATLAYLNNLGCIELNPWNSITKTADKPTYLIIDIDPGDDNTFEQVITAALEFKKLLDQLKLKSFCKTSGATGLHIFLPLAAKYDYEVVKNFAHLLCTKVQEILPAFTTLERNLKKRGKQKIYLDYLQNRKGQTLAAAYSLRPRKGATVSTPLEWKEVKKGLSPDKFTIHNITARVQKKGDLFKGVLGQGVNLEAALKLLQKLMPASAD